ncbi:MAG: CoA transferase [Chloroflexi bacterium]|nr:CoA transferase [Chloroflexota bacterium]
MAPALDDITVLDLTAGMAGALATMFLCDNGARVVRIEAPGGGALRQAPGYRVWDRGKERVALDLQKALDEGDSDEHRDFRRLVRGADVLVESLAPSSPMQALVDYNALSSLNPRLVHCSITAYGRQGPLKDEPADDDLVMARTGILASQPSFRPGPVHVVLRVPSVGAALHAAQGIVASLFARERTGRGRAVEVSLMSGALDMAPRVAGDRLKPMSWIGTPSGGTPFYSMYLCADGEWLQLACIHAGFVALAAEAMDITDVLADPRYGGGHRQESEEAQKELFDIVSGVMKTRSCAEWEEVFERADVPYARVQTVEEAMDDPKILANDMLIELEDPEVGPMAQMGLPIKLLKTPGEVRGPAARHASWLDDGPSPLPSTSEVDDGALDAPLAGVKVLEMASVIAGPHAGWLLSELGADVTKLESRKGDISRPSGTGAFFYLNSNKRSISVDGKAPEGREIVRALAKSSDVVLENMRPGAAVRLGLDPDWLDEANPGLVYTHVTGFGSTGPYSHRPGLDPLSEALTGLERAQGGPENPPVFLAVLGPADYTAAMLGALGTVLALFAKARCGVGQRVETNLLNAGVLLGSDAFTSYAGKPPRRPAGKGQHGLDALHRLYETDDGWLYVVVDTEEEWRSLCDVLGRHDLSTDDRFSAPAPRGVNDADLAREMDSAFKERSAEEWVRMLTDASVPCAPVVEGYDAGFFEDPQAIANDLIAEHKHPNLGRLRLSSRLVGFPGSAQAIRRPTPLLGEHTAEVLREAGYTEPQIADLYEKGVVKTEGPSGEP